jgi:hypothetical protein
VSFDVFVQGFHDGAARAMAPEVFDTVFGPHTDHAEPEYGYQHVATADGTEADVYVDVSGGGLTGVMINDFSPGQVLDLVAEFARRADAVIIPVDCPTLLVSAEQIRHLPGELQDDVLVIETGADIDAAIRARQRSS